MNNELYFLRSCNLRLPVSARFVDEFGNYVRSPEEVEALAIRNRPERAFRKIESNLNGFRSTRNPDDLAWEEYFVNDDEYGLNLANEGPSCVPLSAVQISEATRVGKQLSRSIGSTQTAFRIPSEENPNYATRARQFAEKWNYEKAQWDGDITIPVEVGPHRPYSSKKAVRTKFIPYIGQEQLRFEWQRSKAEFDYKGPDSDKMPVAKYLFEQSNRLHLSARDAPIARQIGETEPFSVWFGDDFAFMIIPHDNAPVRGQDTQAIRCHADVCRRFPPGSTMEFDGAAIQAVAQGAQHAFAENWFAKPYRVFRVQDCSLGAVGGRFGVQGNVSATAKTADISQCADDLAKFAEYTASLSVAGAAGIAIFNSTYHHTAAVPNTFPVDANQHGNHPPPNAKTYQLGRVLCERSSVVIFCRDSFTMVGKLNDAGAACGDRVGAMFYLSQMDDAVVGGADEAFNSTFHPQAYFVIRRYKTAAESLASAANVPVELQGQTIAVELARSGHMTLFGIQRCSVIGAGGGVVAAGVVAGDGAGRQACIRTCFQGRFEAKEGELPPTMTIAANGAPVPMTDLNLDVFGAGLPGRWDVFEVVKAVSMGAGDSSQLFHGYTTAYNAYNAQVYATALIQQAANVGAAGWVPHSMIENNATVLAGRPSPATAKGRYKYVLTTSGVTWYTYSRSLF